jgi:hypothetical protein
MVDIYLKWQKERIKKNLIYENVFLNLDILRIYYTKNNKIYTVYQNSLLRDKCYG